MARTLIQNGLIVDGTGAEAYPGHVLVAADRIEAVCRSDTAAGEDLAARRADRVIDAAGKAVAPGFIDCHSHFIFVGTRTWSTVARAVEKVERARARGLRVMWDVYPHFCGNSYLVVFLPSWFVEDLEANIDDPKKVRRLKIELTIARRLLGFDFADIQIMEARYPAGEKYNGLDLATIAAMEGVDPIDAMLRIVRESGGRALQLTWGYSGDDANEWPLERMMTHPLCLFETDTLLLSRGFPNPASYGAFPRILGHYVREKKTMGLPEAVRKMTGATAEWVGIEARGALRPGYHADIVVFDPATIADNTTRERTDVRPTGIDVVMVNGERVVADGRYLAGKKAGRALRR